MKIERISDNQIRCTLSNFDLSARNLNLSELAYGSEKARNLFREMIQRASSEVGFDAEDIPLMVEAIPLANESVMLIITKVDDPEELDTRFSKFSQSDDEDYWSSLASELLEGADGFLSLLDDAIKERDHLLGDGKAEKGSEKEEVQEQVRIFQFGSLDAVCDAARGTGRIYAGSSTLYKNPVSNTYYLVLTRNGSDEIAFSRTCNILSEYSTRLKYDASTAAYYAEHYDVIVKENALAALAKL